MITEQSRAIKVKSFSDGSPSLLKNVGYAIIGDTFIIESSRKKDWFIKF